MNPTEARLATLRALADYFNPKTNVRSDDVRRVVLAEIAAIEAEARGGEKWTPPNIDNGPSTSNERVSAESITPPEPRFRVGQRVRYVRRRGGSPENVGQFLVITYVGVSAVEGDFEDGTGDGLFYFDEIEPAPAPASPAPPPARPKRIRITYDHYVEPNTKGAVVVPLEWDEYGYPVVRGCEGTRLTLRANQWVPADEPAVEEARERDAFNVWAFGPAGWFHANAKPELYGQGIICGRYRYTDHRIDDAYAAWLARAKVKP